MYWLGSLIIRAIDRIVTWPDRKYRDELLTMVIMSKVTGQAQATNLDNGHSIVAVDGVLMPYSIFLSTVLHEVTNKTIPQLILDEASCIRRIRNYNRLVPTNGNLMDIYYKYPVGACQDLVSSMWHRLVAQDGYDESYEWLRGVLEAQRLYLAQEKAKPIGGSWFRKGG